MSNRYERNMQTLKRINPGLHAWVETSAIVDWISPSRTEDGKANFLITQGAKVVSAYDYTDPLARAKTMIENHKDYLHRNGVTIQVGMGCGHLLNELLRKKEAKHIVILAEPVAHLVRLAFENYDFSKWFENNTLYLAVGKEEVNYLVSIMESKLVLESWLILQEAYISYRVEEYSELFIHINNLINQVRCNVGTVMGAGATIADNDIENLPYVIQRRGVNDLTGLYKGRPAVLVSTGPSLAKNVHLLKEYQGKVVIIAVAQALRILLAYDIVPDFICSVDFGEVNLTHFEGIMDSQVPLVTINRCYAPILKRYEGPIFISATPDPQFINTTVGVLKDKGGLLQAGSVSHLCLGLALHLGCSPITLIGQDLSYEKNQSHFKGADSSGRLEIKDEGQIDWFVDDPRSPLYGKSYSMGTGVIVPGYFGGNVLTNVGLASFISSFETIAESETGKKTDLYNSTEGGADIKQYKKMTLHKYLQLFARGKIKKDKVKELCLDLDPKRDELVAEAIPRLQTDIEILDTIIENCDKALETNKELRKCTKKKSNRLKFLLAENEKYSNAAHEATKKNNLVSLAIYRTSREIQSRAMKVKGKVAHLLRNKQDLMTRIGRNKLILEAAREAAVKLRDSYIESKKKLEDPAIISLEQIGHENVNEVSFEDVDKYFEAGNWVHPLLDTKKAELHPFTIMQKNEKSKIDAIKEKALEMRQKTIEEAEARGDFQPLLEYNQLVLDAHDAGYKNKDFKLALKLLKKAIKLIPEGLDARWGYATALAYLKKFQVSLKEYEKLVQVFPDNLRLQFEYGQILMTVDAKQGLTFMGEFMEKTNQFENFCYYLGSMLMKYEQYEDALYYFERYLKVFPDAIQALEKSAECYSVLGNTAAQKEALDKVKRMRTP